MTQCYVCNCIYIGITWDSKAFSWATCRFNMLLNFYIMCFVNFNLLQTFNDYKAFYWQIYPQLCCVRKSVFALNFKDPFLMIINSIFWRVFSNNAAAAGYFVRLSFPIRNTHSLSTVVWTQISVHGVDSYCRVLTDYCHLTDALIRDCDALIII